MPSLLLPYTCMGSADTVHCSGPSPYPRGFNVRSSVSEQGRDVAACCVSEDGILGSMDHTDYIGQQGLAFLAAFQLEEAGPPGQSTYSREALYNSPLVIPFGGFLFSHHPLCHLLDIRLLYPPVIPKKYGSLRLCRSCRYQG